MKTLQELLNAYKSFGMSDMEIIQNYFIQNDLESDALSMIPALAAAKSDKVQKKFDYARTWSLNFCHPCDNKGKRFDQNTEDKLERLVTYHLFDIDIPEDMLKWAKETIPTMNMPSIFFVPAVEWLGKKYDIYFKNDGKR